MTDTLQYVQNKFGISHNNGVKLPIDVPNFNREKLASLFNELEFRVGVEVGVDEGDYSEVLCKSNLGLTLYCIDCWEVYEDRGKIIAGACCWGMEDYEYRGKIVGDKENLERIYKATKQRLSVYNCKLIRKFSMDAANDFEDESLDFVYIDAAHDFTNVFDDISVWSKKVRKGGIVSGHDFYRFNPGASANVIGAVTTYARNYNIRPWFVLGLRSEVDRDKYRSWLWVKQ